MAWVVYILRCGDDTLYTGITNNLEDRLAKHESGKGAKYTKSRGPFVVLYQESMLSKSDALKRELHIKSFSKDAKLTLIGSPHETRRDL